MDQWLIKTGGGGNFEERFKRRQLEADGTSAEASSVCLCRVHPRLDGWMAWIPKGEIPLVPSAVLIIFLKDFESSLIHKKHFAESTPMSRLCSGLAPSPHSEEVAGLIPRFLRFLLVLPLPLTVETHACEPNW